MTPAKSQPSTRKKSGRMTTADDFAVVIGISRYPELGDLVVAEKNARVFAAWLTKPSGGDVPFENLSLIVTDDTTIDDTPNAPLTIEDLDLAFEAIIKREKREDGWIGRRLYIYASGHGIATDKVDDVALLLGNASPNLLGNSISPSKYADYFRVSGAFREIVLFVDCARTLESTVATREPPWLQVPPSSSVLETSYVYGVASQSNTFGDFTDMILTGLSGGARGPDGPITSQTLASFVSDQLMKLSGGGYRPYFTFGGSHPIVFRRLGKGRSPGSPAAYPTPRIDSDRWAEKDSLGYEPFARTVAMLITHADTVPPLTIGIKAPWGAGKTSLMKRVQYLLDGDAHVTEKNESARRNRTVEVSLTLKQLLAVLRKWSQAPLADPLITATGDTANSSQPTAGVGPSTSPVAAMGILAARDAPRDERSEQILNILISAAETVTKERSQQIRSILRIVKETVTKAARRTQEAVEFKPPQPKASVDGFNREITPRLTVWFNAWKYQTSEQIWAGLAHCIISQVTARMSAINRELFWMKLHAARVDVNQLRWRVRLVVFRDLIPWLPAVGVFAIGAIVLLILNHITLGLLSFGLAPVLAAARYFYSKWKRLGEKVSGTFRELVREPDYEGKLGFLHLVESDIRDVLDLVATERQPLVIFVDDLDRCAPNKVAEIVEAINLFLSGDYPNCIFVLGMEPAIVAAALEVSNKDLLEKVEDFGLVDIHVPLGWRFMEKIVQLPLAIPAPDAEGSRVYLSHLAGGKGGQPTPDPPVAPPADRIAAYVDQLKSAPNINAVVLQTKKLLADEPSSERSAIAEASKRAYALKFTDRDPAISRFIEETITLFRGNPRQLKRYVNLFRFASTLRHNISMDRTAAGIARLKMPSDEILTKFIALSVHWPQAADYLRLVQQMEQPGKTSRQKAALLASLEKRAKVLAKEKPAIANKRWQAYLEELGLGQKWLSTPEFREFLAGGETLGGYEECGLW